MVERSSNTPRREEDPLFRRLKMRVRATRQRNIRPENNSPITEQAEPSQSVDKKEIKLCCEGPHLGSFNS